MSAAGRAHLRGDGICQGSEGNLRTSQQVKGCTGAGGFCCWEFGPCAMSGRGISMLATSVQALDTISCPLMVSPAERMWPQHCWQYIRSTKAAVFGKRKCLKRVRAELFSYIPRYSPGWLLSWSMSSWERRGEAQLSKYFEEVPHLWPPEQSRAPCAVGHRSRSEARPWKGAGTPWAGCRPPRGCQHSDDTTLAVLKSPQREVFCIVHVLIPTLVFLLFSAEFVLGHKALKQHRVEPGKPSELEHLNRKRHFKKNYSLPAKLICIVGFRRTKYSHFRWTSANPDVLCRAPDCGL